MCNQTVSKAETESLGNGSASKTASVISLVLVTLLYLCNAKHKINVYT